ncbi:MAG: YhbY family RNA-binding protein [Candidatus Nezhaarchaeota archaeon]|nr:YhbY family RNA-binding protein [Candidatus Nezhaarchaeota archaeon]
MRGSAKLKVKRRMTGRVDVNVGKRGLTTSVLEEIDRRLNDSELVKVRVLRAALTSEGVDDCEEIVNCLVGKLKPDAVEVRGHTVVLYRKRRRRGTL